MEVENNLIGGKYKIQVRLGQGGFGSAFKVVNEEDHKEYAIKEIPLKDTNEQERKNIEKEGELLSKVNSEYVVKYYNSFVENLNYYLVMEFCDGNSLDFLIEECKAKKTKIPIGIILDIFGQILLGVKSIHEQNIIHRDLKPPNIFLSTLDGKIKIGDFGISKETDPNKKYAKTVAGTVLYTSPEIIQGQKYTNKTDIWSLGCILYELCTLNYIFPCTNTYSFINNVLNNKPQKIDTIYGEGLQVLIDLLLEKDPSKRLDIDSAISELNKCKKFYDNVLDGLLLDEFLESFLIPLEEKENREIEEYLGLKILAQSIFSVKKETILSKILSFAGVNVVCAGIGLIPGLNLAALVGLSAGIGFGGGLIIDKKQKNRKEFIDENVDVIVNIFLDLIYDIKKEIDYKNIEEEGIIALSDSQFNERIIIIKEKFKQENFINKLKKKLDNNFNILLLGNTNSGKSTLINAFLKLSGDNIAKEGEGIPTNTIDFITYKNEVNGNYYILHDTNGITNTGEHCIEKKMERVQEEINRRLKNGKANKLIHCIWYCIAGPNVQESDKELIEKLHNIYTTKQIPIIFVHTQTFSKKQSEKARNGLKKYLTEIYNDEQKAENYLEKYYIDVLSKDWEYEVEDDETGETMTKIKKPFGLDDLEKLSKNEIKENGIKSAYFEYLKKDIIPILINVIYTLIFTKETSEKLVETSVKSINDYLKALVSIINGSDIKLSLETKKNNEKSINVIYKEFDKAKTKLFEKLKNKLLKTNLEINKKEYVEAIYIKKSEAYKKVYSLEKFKDEISDKIFKRVEANGEIIINNVCNLGFNFFIMKTLKNGLKKQFNSKKEEVLNEIYEQLFKE